MTVPNNEPYVENKYVLTNWGLLLPNISLVTVFYPVVSIISTCVVWQDLIIILQISSVTMWIKAGFVAVIKTNNDYNTFFPAH